MVNPICPNSTRSLSKMHASPPTGLVTHAASGTLTTNQPSLTGARPVARRSSRASPTIRFLLARLDAEAYAAGATLPRDGGGGRHGASGRRQEQRGGGAARVARRRPGARRGDRDRRARPQLSADRPPARVLARRGPRG